MIHFKCRCSLPLEVDDDQAGASVQCPGCGLLVDVPTLSDMASLEEDGTFRVEEWVAPSDEGHRVPDLYRTFTRDHVDPVTGEEIDLRLRPEEMDVLPLADPTQDRDPRSLRPKYDPVTGELIRPLDVRGDEPVPADGPVAAGRAAGGAPIPMAQTAPVVAYATLSTQSVPGAWTIAMDLLMPVNAAVMFFVSLAYALGQITLASVIFFLFNLPVAALLLAHYGNVIEDTGPEAKEELPRPLRHLELGPDLWWPFVRMLGALALCYGPSLFVLLKGIPWPVAVLLAGVGSIFAPAVMLTMVTSGSTLNLRPDRVLGVIGAIGGKYAGVVLLWVAAAGLHLWTWLGVVILQEMLRAGLAQKVKWLNHPSVIFPLIAIAIYLMHYFCWYLGVMYRRHQHEFPWVLQRHIPDPNRPKVVTMYSSPRRSKRHGMARPR